MLSPTEFTDEYDEELETKLPDRPISSLRDIQYVYGTLYTLATAGSGDYAEYLTPDEARDLMDQEESLIVVRVDLSGDTPTLADEEPVSIGPYTEDLVERVAHCKYDAARGIDHSVTHRSGRNSDPEKLARYATERLTKWATDEVVEETAADHSDGWILRLLAEAGRDDSLVERIENEVESRLGGSRTALLTVQVTLPDGREFEALGDPDSDGYYWPGDLDAFQAAMRARKLSKLVSKNEAEHSVGAATDLVTGQQTRTVGTAEDPLNYFLGKQMETFPGFDPDEAWRSHPISEDAAVTLMNADTFVEACTYHTFGADVYYLPYFTGRLSGEDIRILYDVLYGIVDREEGMTPVEETYENLWDRDSERRNRLRFYVAAVMKHQSKRYDVFGETMNGSLLHPVELASAHQRVVRSSAFAGADEIAGTPAVPTNENWALLSGEQVLPRIATGSYFFQTFRSGDDDTDASADDFRIEALVSALGGEPIPVSGLLSTYVDRLLESNPDEEFDDFPTFRVASQFAQLSALATADLLDASGEPGLRPITDSPRYKAMTDDEAIADGGQYTWSPAEKLDTFVDETPAFHGSEEDGTAATATQRKGSFLLGALVGEVGSYQAYDQDRSTTVVDQYPVKSITRNRIKKITQETIGKTLTYTRQNDRATTEFEWVIEELRETILAPDPDEWSIGTDDLRFYYALGVTYGMNDRPERTDDATDPQSD